MERCGLGAWGRPGKRWVEGREDRGKTHWGHASKGCSLMPGLPHFPFPCLSCVQNCPRRSSCPGLGFQLWAPFIASYFSCGLPGRQALRSLLLAPGADSVTRIARVQQSVPVPAGLPITACSDVFIVLPGSQRNIFISFWILNLKMLNKIFFLVKSKTFPTM